MLKFSIIIPLIWFLIHFIPRPETDVSKRILNYKETVPIEQNGDVYLSGLNVPPDQSPLKYGQSLYQKYENYSPDFEADFLNKTDDKDFFPIPDDLYKFQGNSIGIRCWFIPNYHDSENSCQSEEELRKTIAQNKVLLSRIKELGKYNYFDNDIRFMTEHYFSGKSFITIQQLFFAQLILLKQDGEAKLAINLWLKNIRMLNKIISGRYDPITRAITAIVLQNSKDTLLKIIDFSILDDALYNEIKNEILKPTFGPNGYDIQKMAQADYNQTLNIITSGYENSDFLKKIKYSLATPMFAKNEFSEYYNDLINLGTLEGQEFIDEYNQLTSRYENKYDYKGFGIIKILSYGTMSKLLLPGIYKSRELVYNRFINSIADRIYILALEAKKNNLTHPDMYKFLQGQPPELKNPINNSAFLWDGEAFYFIVKDNDGMQKYSVMAPIQHQPIIYKKELHN